MAAIVRASEELRIVDHDVLVPVETDTICRLLVAAGDAANANAAGDHVASSRAPNQKLVLFSDGWLDLISQGSIGKVVNRFKDGIKPLEAEKPAPAPKAAPGPESAPHSGIGLTRADYERERRKAERLAAEEAEAAKSSTPIDVVHEDDDDAPSAFRKREPA